MFDPLNSWVWILQMWTMWSWAKAIRYSVIKITCVIMSASSKLSMSINAQFSCNWGCIAQVTGLNILQTTCHPPLQPGDHKAGPETLHGQPAVSIYSEVHWGDVHVQIRCRGEQSLQKSPSDELWGKQRGDQEPCKYNINIWRLTSSQKDTAAWTWEISTLLLQVETFLF